MGIFSVCLKTFSLVRFIHVYPNWRILPTPYWEKKKFNCICVSSFRSLQRDNTQDKANRGVSL